MSVENSALHAKSGNILDGAPIATQSNPADAVASGDRGSILHAFLHEADDHQFGFAGLLDQLRNNGLGGHLNQWAEGNPQGITPDDVGQGLGQTILSNIASRAGVSVRVAADELASLLPRTVQQVAPGGKPRAPQVRSLESEVAKEIL